MDTKAFLPFLTYPDAASAATIPAALAIARQLGASVHALSVEVDIPDVSNALSGLLLDLPAKIRSVQAHSRAQGRDLLAAVIEEAARCGCSATTGEITAQPALMSDAAVAQARYHDLSIMGCPPGNATGRQLAEAVIFGSGRPVVLLPDAWQPRAIGHIVVAWDGSRAAARALADARPFLALASLVSVVTVTDEKVIAEHDGGATLARGLRERGLAAEPCALVAEERPIAVTLQEHVLKTGADLLVMGGYGHSRIRDFVLGGATRGILDDLRVAALVSH